MRTLSQYLLFISCMSLGCTCDKSLTSLLIRLFQCDCPGTEGFPRRILICMDLRVIEIVPQRFIRQALLSAFPHNCCVYGTANRPWIFGSWVQIPPEASKTRGTNDIVISGSSGRPFMRRETGSPRPPIFPGTSAVWDG